MTMSSFHFLTDGWLKGNDVMKREKVFPASSPTPQPPTISHLLKGRLLCKGDLQYGGGPVVVIPCKTTSVV